MGSPQLLRFQALHLKSSTANWSGGHWSCSRKNAVHRPAPLATAWVPPSGREFGDDGLPALVPGTRCVEQDRDGEAPKTRRGRRHNRRQSEDASKLALVRLRPAVVASRRDSLSSPKTIRMGGVAGRGRKKCRYECETGN